MTKNSFYLFMAIIISVWLVGCASQPATPSEPTPVVTMAVYRSHSYPFMIQYPTLLESVPPPKGGTAGFAAFDIRLVINEVDLEANKATGAPLDKFVDSFLGTYDQQSGPIKVISRQRTTNAQGLPIECFRFQVGVVDVNGLFYLHENKTLITAVYYFPIERFEELAPVVAKSFDSFQLVK
jgi:hypothetical protein